MWCHRTRSGRTTSSRRCSTRTWLPWWPPRCATQPPSSLTDDRPMDEMASDALAGLLLVATPMLGDPNFRRPVVLVVEHEAEQGSLGVVLNRPIKVPVGQVLAPWTELDTAPS